MSKSDSGQACAAGFRSVHALFNTAAASYAHSATASFCLFVTKVSQYNAVI